jgi:glycosyltransferase involved in cell wall biosynthesis
MKKLLFWLIYYQCWCLYQINKDLVNMNEKRIVYSVIIPAFNEEKSLHQTLTALKNAMESVDFSGEAIVTDNNSTDKTRETAEKYGAKVVFEPVNQIARSRNRGAHEAKGEYLVFLDADTTITPRLLQTALHKLMKENCCGGGTIVELDRPLTFVARKFLAGWTFLSRRFHLAAGCFIYVLREAFEDIGGFDERVYASEEIWFSRRLKRWGRKHGKPFHLIEDQTIVTSARKLDHPLRIILVTIMGVIIPFSIFSRTLCWFWYKRPSD